MVDEQLEALRQRHAAHKAPEPARASAKGDIVTIDFTLSIEGTEVKDGGGQGIDLELGAGQALPELDEALVGKNVGDELKTDVPFSATHPRADFKGKTGTFASTVKDIKEKVLPALDDEFSKDVGQFTTLVELRADIHTKLEKMAKDRSETSLAEQIVAKLNENNPLDVPPSLVQQQAQMMEQEIAQQARRMGQRITREQAQALHSSVVADAEKKVRAGLLMAAIARKHEFKITDEDIERGLAELAEETGKNVAKLRAEYRGPAKARYPDRHAPRGQDPRLRGGQVEDHRRGGALTRRTRHGSCCIQERRDCRSKRGQMTNRFPETRSQVMSVLERAVDERPSAFIP